MKVSTGGDLRVASNQQSPRLVVTFGSRETNRRKTLDWVDPYSPSRTLVRSAVRILEAPLGLRKIGLEFNRALTFHGTHSSDSFEASTYHLTVGILPTFVPSQRWELSHFRLTFSGGLAISCSP